MFAVVLAVALLVAAQAHAQIPVPASVTIAQAVSRARAESPLRATAAAVADGTALAARLAGRPLNPLVDVRAENLTPSGTLSPDRDVFAVISQPIELGGKRGKRKDIAAADSDVSHLLLRMVERQIALDTVRAYMRAVRARDVLDTLTAQRDGVDTIVATMRRRVDEGFAPESDLLRFEAESARMGAEMTRTQIELTRALSELGWLIGTATPLAAAQLVTPDPIAPLRPSGDALAAAIERRPDLMLTGSRVERARLTATFEQQRRLPDPSISAGYKRTQGQNTAVAGIVVAVPLFDRNNQARAVAEAGVKAAEADQAAVRARAIVEANASLEAASALAESIERVRRDLLGPAENVRNAARAMFREGATDVLKVVDAERVYTDMRREALSLGSDAYVAAIEARFAVGEEDIP